MNRRFLCVLLSALILIGLFPAAALPVHAVTDMKTSEKCVEILKDMEGFIPYAKADNGQYSIGYGSGCDPKDYPDGITKEEAEELLLEYLAKFEKNVNSMAKRYNLTFTQYQFDALMLFSYNVGGAWTNSDGDLRQAVINGATGNDFIYPFCRWSTASGKLNVNLVQRRLAEANLYLNGVYGDKAPASYTYVLYEHCGGVSDVKVQGYDANLPATVMPVPTKAGYRFLGWYTAEEGGAWVTELDAKMAKKTLYAHWQEGTGNMATGTPASYQRTTDQLSGRSLHEAPGGKAVGEVAEGATLTIVADYVDDSMTKWGKLKEGNWVNMGNALVGVVSSGQVIDPVEVTVTSGGVNVRTGPGVNYAVCGNVSKGDKITITKTQMNGTILWGRFVDGWLSLRYTNYTEITGNPDDRPDENPTDPADVIDTGTVTTGLNVRGGPGTNYPVVGYLSMGDEVQITQKKTVDNVLWGKISKGWISLKYVKLDSASDGDETEPDVENPTDPDAKVSGTVTTGLNIRSGAGTNFAIVGGYKMGTRVEILAQKNVAGTNWGQTDKGWISMKYVKLDGTQTPDVEPDENENGASGVVITKTGLLIRKGPGTNYAMVGSYSYGTKILVKEQTNISGVSWGHTDRGWVCLTYVKMSGNAPQVDPPLTDPEPDANPEEKPSVTTGNGTVISNTELNIRSAPGTQNPQVGTYNPGDRITILEQQDVDGTYWGRTDRGWVCMRYVQMDSDSNTQFTATVTASSLCYRNNPGMDTTVLGYYKNGDQVKILETTYVKGQEWGKTDKGWICMAYVKK